MSGTILDPTLVPYEIDFSLFFAQVQSSIQYMRTYRNIRPLTPNMLLVGKESLNLQVAPPSIAIVPTGFRYSSARMFPDSTEPRPIFSQWMQLEISCWGDDDPAKVNQLYSFSTTLELAREVIVALCDNNYGPSSVRVDASEWVQETSISRVGRKLFIRAEVETFVVRDPPIIMSGVVASVTGNLESIDGSTIQQVVTFTVPP